MSKMGDMARPLRIENAGGWYHVTARASERKSIFRGDRDRQDFLQFIEEMVRRFRVRLHCFVLMDNHYHLLLELAEANLSRAVQWLNLSYGMSFNRRHGHSGRLFQGRFKSVALSPQEWALALSRYLHLNPVRTKKAGLRKDRRAQRAALPPARNSVEVRQRMRILRRYRWSSYRAYIGLPRVPDWLECQTVLGFLGGNKGEQHRRYQEYVETAVREGLEKSPWESVQKQVMLGGAKFAAQIRKHMMGGSQKQRRPRRVTTGRPKFEAVIAAIEKVKGRKWAEFRDEYGDAGRDMALYLGRRLCGTTLAELAKAAKLRNYGVVATNAKRYELRLNRDRTEKTRMKQVLELLNPE